MGFFDNRVLRLLLYMVTLFTLGYLVPQSIGLGAGGFDSSFVLTQFTFYISGAIFLIIVTIFAFIRLGLSGKYPQYGDTIAFADQGEHPALGVFKKLNALQFILLSTIIFSILGLFALLTQQTSFTAFKVLEQQFTPIGEISYSALLIPIAENAGAMAVIALMFFILFLAAKKYQWSKTIFGWWCYLLIPFSVGLYGWINHLLRYGSSELSKWVVFWFWTAGGFLTVFTGSAIPFLIMHQDNNLFFDLKRFYSNDYITVFTVVGIIILTIIFIYITFGKKKEAKPFISA